MSTEVFSHTVRSSLSLNKLTFRFQWFQFHENKSVQFPLVWFICQEFISSTWKTIIPKIKINIKILQVTDESPISWACFRLHSCVSIVIFPQVNYEWIIQVHVWYMYEWNTCISNLWMIHFSEARLNYTAQNKKCHLNTNLVPFPSFRENEKKWFVERKGKTKINKTALRRINTRIVIMSWKA